MRVKVVLAHIRKADVPLGIFCPSLLQLGRDELEERLAVVVGSLGELRDKLQAWLDGAKDVGELASRARRSRQSR